MLIVLTLQGSCSSSCKSEICQAFCGCAANMYKSDLLICRLILYVQVIDECLGLRCGHDEKSEIEPIKHKR